MHRPSRKRLTQPLRNTASNTSHTSRTRAASVALFFMVSKKISPLPAVAAWQMENLLCPKIFYFCLRVQMTYSILGLLFISIQSLIRIIQTSMTSLLNLATSLMITNRTHCGDRPRKLRLASSFDGLLHPPTHAGHKLLKKLDQNRTAYTVQQKPFIRFPHLPNRAPYGAPPPIAWTTTVRLIQM